MIPGSTFSASDSGQKQQGQVCLVLVGIWVDGITVGIVYLGWAGRISCFFLQSVIWRALMGLCESSCID